MFKRQRDLFAQDVSGVNAQLAILFISWPR